jgi:uncharacterized protein (TIGR00304 family)
MQNLKNLLLYNNIGRLAKMNRYHLFAVILLICGIISLGYSVASGEGSAGVVVFIPVFFGSGLFSFIGVLCIMAAIFLAFFGFAKGSLADEGVEEQQGQRTSSPSQSRQSPRPQKSIKGGGVVLIGPIPVVFGSDAKTAMILMVLAIILIVVVFVLFYSSLL